MRIARVVGTVTGTVKEPTLASHKLLIVDIEDGEGNVLEPSVVAVDTVGAGSGERVLVATGSAARIPSPVAGLSVDVAIIAIIDEISFFRKSAK